MNAIKKVRLFMQAHPDSQAARVLAGLAAALADDQPFPLGQLYELELEAFDLAIDLMRDWRLDRYYAARLKLLDTILVDVLPELGADNGGAPQVKPVGTVGRVGPSA
jgi:ATP-dependent protease HslVU (ClpYQ) peptidase subunit